LIRRIHPRVAWQLLDGDVVLIDLDKGNAVGLNETGSFLWSRITQADEAGLVRDLSATFDVAPARAEQDVRAFLGFLEERGFVE
jgi:hypothetical protein